MHHERVPDEQGFKTVLRKTKTRWGAVASGCLSSVCREGLEGEREHVVDEEMSSSRIIHPGKLRIHKPVGVIFRLVSLLAYCHHFEFEITCHLPGPSLFNRI